MPGRAQHPTPDMLSHAHRLTRIAELKTADERLTMEINDHVAHRAQVRRELRKLEKSAAARVA